VRDTILGGGGGGGGGKIGSGPEEKYTKLVGGNLRTEQIVEKSSSQWEEIDKGKTGGGLRETRTCIQLI